MKNHLEKAVATFIDGIRPDTEDVARHILDIRKAHPSLSNDALANKWADKVCWRFASEGAVTALHSAIPGLGTAAQIAIESGTISADLAYMIRCLAGVTIGVGQIYGRDTEASFNQDFVRVLALWCGLLQFVKGPTVAVTKKIAVAQFKKVPAEIFKRINKKVGTTIVTKYGSKRGGIAIGRLIPFGVGVVAGGGFNLVTMKAFKKSAAYYKTSDAILLEKS